MEITNKRYGTPTYKSEKIYNWKRQGVKHDGWDALFQHYINTTHCQHCDKIFTSSKDRHLDHDHTTGIFRMVVCKNCNNHDSYIKYPDGYDKKEYMKEYNKEYNAKNWENNKDKIKAWKSEKIECDCGSVVRKGDISQHKKTAKHLAFTNQLQ